MNEIIKELYTIEEHAARIMENTKLQRQELQQEQREKERQIQRELQQEMEGRLSILQSELEEQSEKEIQEIIQKNQAVMTELNQTYDGNYEAKAQEILKRITEV